MNGIVASFVIAYTASSSLLISTDDLVKSQSGVTILDVRPLDAYKVGHISGAKQLDTASLSETREGVKGELKPVEAVTKALADSGVGRENPVVVYGSMKSPQDLSSTTRMFWILEVLAFEKVSIMDGGIEKWTAEKRPVEVGEPKAAPVADLKVLFRPEMLATKQQVQDAGAAGAVLLDSRVPEQYRGVTKEDSVARLGRIPGAVNLPAGQCVSDSKTLKSWDELQALMKQNVKSTDTKLITYCNTGRSASVAYFVARMLGYKDVKLYDGSMAEWGLDNALPVETGESKASK
jgi:thiosulfate/3-mercaptopyruvate sulfurtransferase